MKEYKRSGQEGKAVFVGVDPGKPLPKVPRIPFHCSIPIALTLNFQSRGHCVTSFQLTGNEARERTDEGVGVSFRPVGYKPGVMCPEEKKQSDEST